jgi:adenine-specific DNA-methyltransferase
MPTLHWIGKDKVINHHLDVPFKVLEHTYTFNNGTQTTPSPLELLLGHKLRRVFIEFPPFKHFIKFY